MFAPPFYFQFRLSTAASIAAEATGAWPVTP